MQHPKPARVSHAEGLSHEKDEFIALEESSCADTSTDDFEYLTTADDTTYRMNKRYLEADVVNRIFTMATDASAGIGGAMTNLKIGATPAA